MRLTLILLTSLIVLHSCSDDVTDRIVDNSSIGVQKIETPNKAKRRLIIQELKTLQAVFSSQDKERIADVFLFPLAATKLEVLIDDSSYSRQLEKNGNKIPRSIFIDFYSQLHANLQLPEINEIFRFIDPQGLLQKDTVKIDLPAQNEPCYKYYSINIEEDVATLAFGNNSNRDYKSTKVTTDLGEDPDEYCEYASFRVFQFKNKKLLFVKHSAAG
ncbi:MAG: hypothetical protein WKF70_08425 [Chitinophagaceae bacterium]